MSFGPGFSYGIEAMKTGADVKLCPNCGSEMKRIKLGCYGDLSEWWECTNHNCGHLELCGREEKLGEKPTTYPDGVPIFPDDTPCPKCGYHTVLLHSHGDIGLECPKCDWCKTVKECMAEKVKS
jgi:ribosomal protein S27AE